MSDDPRRPPDPTPPDAPAEALADPERRRALGASLALGGLLAAAGAAPVIAVVLDPVGTTSVERGGGLVAVGEAGSFVVGQPTLVEVRGRKRDAWSNLGVVTIGRAFVVRGADETFTVWSSVCPHLGCSVQRDPATGGYVCPCHQGVFDAAGGRVSGPPQRGLDPLEHRVEDGVLQVRFERFALNTPERVRG